MENDSGTEQSLRKYYDRVPYPANPIDDTLSENADVLYTHNFLTPYYLRNRVLPPSKPLRILDAGCGSGFKTLALAQANPGAKIMGIDLSDMSLQIARQRLARHGYEQAEFFVLPIERVGELGEFDYINCDEVLYLLPEPEAALAALKAVLAPGGILRTNLHNRYQREPLYRAQRAFRLMNAAGELREEAQSDLVRTVMNNLKDSVYLKHVCWNGQSDQKERSEWIEMNYLLEGDKGFTVPEMFEMLKGAALEFVGMVQWPQWELLELFKEDSVPTQFERIYRSLPLPERLHLYELMHGKHRLLDFWCGHPGEGITHAPRRYWSDADLDRCTVRLHPQLATEALKSQLLASIETNGEFHLNAFLREPGGADFVMMNKIARGLLPLWDGPQPLGSFLDNWTAQTLALAAADGIELSLEAMRQDLKMFILQSEMFAYTLVVRGS